MTSRIAVRSRRQAMDWSLVLVSQGIETAIDSDELHGWSLTVSDADFPQALAVLKAYQQENRHWPWRREIPSQGLFFDWGSLGWALLTGLFFWAQTRSGSQFQEAGLMDSIAVSHGEWWRLFTAMFLHADLGHFAMNASVGVFLLGLSMGSFGTGIGLCAAYLAGALGNVSTWLIFPEGHRSLGASGMVMGCAGLLASQSLFTRLRMPNPVKHLLSRIAGGVMLFALLGLTPGTDVLAHLGGFVGGIALGGILLLRPSVRPNTAVNLFAGCVFFLLVVIPWWLALTRAYPPR